MVVILIKAIIMNALAVQNSRHKCDLETRMTVDYT